MAFFRRRADLGFLGILVVSYQYCMWKRNEMNKGWRMGRIINDEEKEKKKGFDMTPDPKDLQASCY